ncbi:hypothetical protein MTO96_018885 [Rhipicephalus appendiculatus]
MRYAAQLHVGATQRPTVDSACKPMSETAEQGDHVAPAQQSCVAHQQGPRGGRAALEPVRQQRRLLHVGGRPWRRCRCTAQPAALGVQV